MGLRRSNEGVSLFREEGVLSAADEDSNIDRKIDWRRCVDGMAALVAEYPVD